MNERAVTAVHGLATIRGCVNARDARALLAREFAIRGYEADEIIVAARARYRRCPVADTVIRTGNRMYR